MLDARAHRLFLHTIARVEVPAQFERSDSRARLGGEADRLTHGDLVELRRGGIGRDLRIIVDRQDPANGEGIRRVRGEHQSLHPERALADPLLQGFQRNANRYPAGITRRDVVYGIEFEGGSLALEDDPQLRHLRNGGLRRAHARHPTGIHARGQHAHIGRNRRRGLRAAAKFYRQGKIGVCLAQDGSEINRFAEIQPGALVEIARLDLQHAAPLVLLLAGEGDRPTSPAAEGNARGRGAGRQRELARRPPSGAPPGWQRWLPRKGMW